MCFLCQEPWFIILSPDFCQKSDQLLAKKKKKKLNERRVKKNVTLPLRPLSRLHRDLSFSTC